MVIARALGGQLSFAHGMGLQRDVLDVKHGIDHAQTQPLALASAGAVVQREARGRKRVHGTANVTECKTNRHGRAIWQSSLMHEAEKSLGSPVVAGFMGQRAFATEGRDRCHDDVRFDRLEIALSEAAFFQNTRPEVFDHPVDLGH